MAAARGPGWKELSGGPAQPRPRQAAEPEPQRRSGAAVASPPARPPARQPASACGEPARLPAGAQESHRHRPAQAQAQALRRAKRSGVYPGPANRRGGGGPKTCRGSSILQGGSGSSGVPDRARRTPMASAACPGPGDPAM